MSLARARRLIDKLRLHGEAFNRETTVEQLLVAALEAERAGVRQRAAGIVRKHGRASFGQAYLWSLEAEKEIEAIE
jgi:hypothetical protein